MNSLTVADLSVVLPRPGSGDLLPSDWSLRQPGTRLRSRRDEPKAQLPCFQVNPSPIEHKTSIRYVQRIPDVLLYEQHAHAAISRRPDRRQQPPDHDRGKPEGEFVHEQQPRLTGQGSCESQHLLLTARQEPDLAAQERLKLRKQF
jgi:hypothetical protein